MTTPTPPRLAALPDDRLVAMAQANDIGAFEELVGRHEDHVFRLAMRFMRSETEAKEVMQDAFLSAWRKLADFKGDAQFGSWLYRVTANAALMRLRTQRRHPETSTEDLPPGTLDTHEGTHGHGENWARRPDEELASAEVRKHIQAAVDDLPEIYRTVFLLRDVEEIPTEETAQMLGISIPTVKTRLHRARLALRERIGRYFDNKTS